MPGNFVTASLALIAIGAVVLVGQYLLFIYFH